MCVANYINLCTKFTVEAKNSDGAKSRLFILYAFSLGLCVILGAVLCLLPTSALISMIGYEELVYSFRLIGLFLPVFMLQPLNEGILRGIKKFKLIGILQVLSSILFFLFVVIGIFLDGYKGGIYGVFSYYGVYALISLYAVLRHVPLRRYFKSAMMGSKDEVRVIQKMIFPVFMLSFIEAPLNWWAQLLLAKTGGMEAISSMTAILQIRNFAIILPSYYINTFTSFASTSNAAKDFNSYYRKFSKSQKLFWIASILLFLALQLSDNVILRMYGEAYVNDTYPFLIANLAIPFLIIGNLLKIDLIIHEHQQLMLCVSMISIAVFIGVVYLLLYMNINCVAAYFYGQLAQTIVVFGICKYQFNKDRKILLYEKI